MESMTAVDSSMTRATDYLKAQQEDCGSFWILISADPHFPAGSAPEHSVFATAVILYCLEWRQDLGTQEIRKQALAFLQAETNERGLCRYLSSFSLSRVLDGKISIPLTTVFDVDTTSCVSDTLRRHGSDFTNQTALLANCGEDGRFGTWLLHEPIPEDAAGFPFICFVPQQTFCAGISANALLYLGESAETQKAAEQLADIFCTRAHRTASPYYTDEIVLFYLVSRACFAGVRTLQKAFPAIKEVLQEHQRPDGSFGTALQTALALCTLRNFDAAGPEQESGTQFLIQAQEEDGSWPCGCFYFWQGDDMVPEWRYGSLRRRYEHSLPPLYFGSAEITTAFCLEALSRSRGAVR